MRVTTAQLEHVRTLADAKGMTKDEFQVGIDYGDIAAALDRAKVRYAFGGLLPPDGGRIHILSDVLVREAEDWTQALEAAGPDTPPDYNIRRVGDLYPPSGRGDVRKDFVLLHRPGWNLDQFLVWGKGNRLRGTTARDVFAVGREKPDLHRELGMDPMWVHASDVQLFEGFRHVPSVWWYGAERRADRYWVGRVGRAGDWCLLSRE